MRTIYLNNIERWSEPMSGSYRPCLLMLDQGETKALRKVCETRGFTVADSLHRQLAELATICLPASDHDERAQWVEERIETYAGSWVFLPWDRQIVRVLEADDYFQVVTNRNRDKITLEEQRLLRTKRVGVMGLSVGGEAAVTIAQEHLCGHMVLADFDALDLSNLNRLQSGIGDLDENKAVLIARRIARIDPYIAVTVYEDGVTDENMDEFLDGLDLLVEECDHLPIKFAVREKARSRGLNIVFAGDERGFLSIEPYGDYPDLPPFHGFVEAPPPPRSSFSTDKEFWKVLSVWLGGWNAISDRSRNSVGQVGQSLVGYPQLASEARYAAGQVGHVARRLLLGEKIPPFVGHLDLDELLTTHGQAS